MSSDKISFTIFDILGYLLPGYIVLFGLSLIEATFTSSSFLSLVSLGDNILLFTIVAYYLGQFCHILATKIKNLFYRIFKPENQRGKRSSIYSRTKYKIYNLFINNDFRLSEPLYKKFEKSILEAYDIKLVGDEKIHTLEKYLLADSYLVASGCENERMSLMVREGFYKTSVIAFAILELISFVSLFFGGIKVQIEAGNVYEIGISITIIFTVISLIFFILFWGRNSHYNRIKINNTYLLFLAYKEKSKHE